MEKAHWEHFEHGADIGVRGYGKSLAQAFEQCALALTGVITDTKKIDARDCFEVTCTAEENDLLLIDWLNELIYQMATRHMLFSNFNIKIDDHHLVATVCGEHAEQSRHHPAVEVKGATFTELSVSQNNTGEWIAQCIVDV